ncbi:hypothetical protein SDJN02_01409, partial [Cucurbita argyrosperma subsp. argyrosperma]
MVSNFDKDCSKREKAEAREEKSQDGYAATNALFTVRGSSAASVNGDFLSSGLRRKQRDNGGRRHPSTSTVKNAGEAPEAAAVAAMETLIQCALCQQEEGPKHFGSSP